LFLVLSPIFFSLRFFSRRFFPPSPQKTPPFSFPYDDETFALPPLLAGSPSLEVLCWHPGRAFVLLSCQDSSSPYASVLSTPPGPSAPRVPCPWEMCSSMLGSPFRRFPLSCPSAIFSPFFFFCSLFIGSPLPFRCVFVRACYVSFRKIVTFFLSIFYCGRERVSPTDFRFAPSSLPISLSLPVSNNIRFPSGLCFPGDFH